MEIKENRFVTDWDCLDIPALPDNADELIQAKVNDQQNHLQKHKFGEVCRADNIVNYRDSNQVFAVFGDTAYELLNMTTIDNGCQFAYRPALLDNTAYQSLPHEGSTGVLHWWWSDKLDEWNLTWLNSGWIHTRELDMTPDEISDNIEDEIISGQTPLTGNNSKADYQ